MSRDITPMPKPAKRAKKQRRGRARPDEPLATWCEICGLNLADQRHHILRRSAGGTDDRDNTLDVCLPCHHHIHANPAASYEAGYLRKRGNL